MTEHMTENTTESMTGPMNATGDMPDIVIIGAGMGGGIAARALTAAGWQVVLLEKGTAGHRREETRLDLALGNPVGRALRGFWPDAADVTVDGRQMNMHLPLGSGVGGSSVFYAATLERPALHDIEEVAGLPHPTGGWPMSWADLAPWFDAAQEMLGLNGTPDPLDPRPVTLRAPPPQTTGDQAIMAHLQGNGLHPYHLHSAVAHLEGCASCLGRSRQRHCRALCAKRRRTCAAGPSCGAGGGGLVLAPLAFGLAQ